jgi:hypothetical protein
VFRVARRGGAFLGLVATALLVGCQAPRPVEAPTREVVAVADYESFVRESLTALRLQHFPPEYVDETRGLIVTAPATTGQWFEVWRNDARGPYQTLEANLHTMRRVVEVRLTPVGPQGAAAGGVLPGEPGAYALAVEARRQRYSTPPRQARSTSMALNLYHERMPTTAGVLGPAPDTVWIDLGRDAQLERFLLEQLVQHGHTTGTLTHDEAEALAG